MKYPFMNLKIIAIAAIIMGMASCQKENNQSDAYGNFETTEITVSAQAQGELMRFEIVNGMNLREKQVVGYVDTTSLVIQKEQLQAQKKAVAAKLTELKAREAVHIQQIDNLQTTFKRIAGLFDEDAATQQQFDDIDGKVKLAQKQLRQIKTQRNSILSEMNVIDKKIKLVNHQIDKAVIISPVNSKVIEKLVDRGEVVNMGAPSSPWPIWSR